MKANLSHLKSVEMQVTYAVIDKKNVSGTRKAARQLVSLYNIAPQEEMTLDEFELVSMQRQQLLRGIEMLLGRGFEGDEMAKKMKQVISFISLLISKLL